MARSLGVYTTSDSFGKELREDLINLVTNISPKKTPFYSGLKSTTANATVHSWTYDAYARTSSQQTHPEGGDFTFGDQTAPTRGTNVVQGFVGDVKVSWEQNASESAGGKSLPRLKAKALAEWKLQVEYHLLNGSLVSASSNVGFQLKGAVNFVDSGNINSYASLSCLTETIFDDLVEELYTDADAEVAEAYMKIALKKRMSSFTASNTRNVSADDRRLIKPVDVIETDAVPMVKLFAHRDMPDNKILAIIPEYFRVAYLIKPEYRTVPSTGSYDAGVWYGALTLEVLDPKASALAVNIAHAQPAV